MLCRGKSVVIVIALVAACGSSGGGSHNGSGGSTASGGATSSGGRGGSGGVVASGGAVSTGGAMSTGGSLATGGSSGTGGTDAGPPPVAGGAGGKDAAADQPIGGTGGADAPLSFDVVETGRSDGVTSRDVSSESPSTLDAASSLRLAVPLYIWPGDGSAWAQVAAAGTAVSYIVANAGDPGGPGPSADPTYTTAITSAHQAGQRVLGYVDTSFAARTLSAAQAEVDQWYSFYPQIDGIFLDQTPGEVASIATYYKPLSDQIRGKSGAHVVIINPGQPNFAEGYMALADIAMSFENPYGSASDGYGPGQYSAPAWMSKYSADRFWHVILEVADATAMRSVLDLVRSRNAGHVYVTNYADPPAYARLPTYFTDEVVALGW